MIQIDIKELSIIQNENKKKEDIMQNKNKKKKKKKKKKIMKIKKIKKIIMMKKGGARKWKKYEYIDVIVLDKNIIIGGESNGELHIFEIDNSSIESKCIIDQKAHIKSLIYMDNIKDNNNRFVTCDEKEIKIWLYKKKKIMIISLIVRQHLKKYQNQLYNIYMYLIIVIVLHL